MVESNASRARESIIIDSVDNTNCESVPRQRQRKKEERLKGEENTLQMISFKFIAQHIYGIAFKKISVCRKDLNK